MEDPNVTRRLLGTKKHGIQFVRENNGYWRCAINNETIRPPETDEWTINSPFDAYLLALKTIESLWVPLGWSAKDAHNQIVESVVDFHYCDETYTHSAQKPTVRIRRPRRNSNNTNLTAKE